jgi:ABC-type antimicrobial peptide transport system permease subunit
MSVAMSPGNLLRIALVAMGRHKMRSALTMLGLIIGVAAVLTMVALGNGAQRSVSDEVRSAGTNLVFVRAGNYTRGGDAVNIPSGAGAATTLTGEDARAVREVAGIAHASAEVNDRAPVVNGPRKWFGPVTGIDVEYPLVFSWEWLHGGPFTPADLSGARRVALLGRDAHEVLFGIGVDPTGRTIDIRDTTYTVTGVFESRDSTQADSIVVPYPALQEALGIHHLHGITLSTVEAGDASAVADAIRELLRARHRIGQNAASLPASSGLGGFQGARTSVGGVPDDFTVRTQASAALTKGLYTSAAAFVLASMSNLDQVTSAEMAGTLQRSNRTMTVLLASLAAVSLFVGGLGIMNVMLLAVTERTREIGLRMAVGARTRDVMRQFLLEAVLLSALGGCVGVLLGFAASAVVTRLLEWPTAVSPGAVALAFGLSAAVGVLFGFYPARKAAALDPIDALRYE